MTSWMLLAAWDPPTTLGLQEVGQGGGRGGRGERGGEGGGGRERGGDGGGGRARGGEGTHCTTLHQPLPSLHFPLPAASLLQQSPQPAILEARHMVSWSSKGGDVVALSLGGGAAAVSWVNHT